MKIKQTKIIDLLTFHFFLAIGRAESIKLLLADANIQYQFESIEHSDWLPIKEKLISEGHPQGCLPYIVLDDKWYFGSTPILRFLCKKLGM